MGQGNFSLTNSIRLLGAGNRTTAASVGEGARARMECILFCQPRFVSSAAKVLRQCATSLFPRIGASRLPCPRLDRLQGLRPAAIEKKLVLQVPCVVIQH